MSSFHERYVAWRELYREPAMQYRTRCQNHLPPEQIAAIDRMLEGSHGHKLYWHWWSELRSAAPREAKTVCPVDHNDVWELANGHCVCCGLVMTEPPVKTAEPNPEPAMQLAFEV